MTAKRKSIRPGKLLIALAVPLLAAMGFAVFAVLGTDPDAPGTDEPGRPNETATAEPGSRPAEDDTDAPTDVAPGSDGGADPATAALISGRLRNYRTREPIVGMELTLAAAALPEGGRAVAVVTTSGPDGAFRFTRLPPRGGYELNGARDPFAPVALPGLDLAPSQVLDLGTIWLDVPVDLPVLVLDMAGAPVADAEVAVYATAGSAAALPANEAQTAEGAQTGASAGVAASPRPTATATTDGAGAALVVGLLPGTYHVRASAAGHASASRSGVTLAPDAASVPVRLLLPTGHTLTGIVQDAEGEPVAEARVIAAPQSSRKQAADKLEAETGADGAYRLEGLSPGIHTLYLARPERPLVSAGSVRIPEMDRWDIRLRPTAVLVGTVTDRDGEPVADAEIEYAPQGGLPLQTRTGEDGTYRLEDVPAGPSQWFRVRATGYIPFPDPTAPQQGTGESLREGAEVRRDVSLEAGTRVTIRVLAEGDDAPVEAAAISLRMAQMWGGSGEPWRATTDAEGMAEFPGVVGGTYLVQIAAPGFVQEGMPPNWSAVLQSPQAIPETWRLDVSEATTATFRLAVGTSVSGTVRGTDGQPYEGALVAVTGAQPMVPTYTNAEGAFTVEAVPASRRAVATASAPGIPGSKSEPFIVEAGKAVTEVEIELQGGATIMGHARSSDGRPLEGAFVRYVPGQLNERNPWGFQAFDRVEMHPVAADGSYSIPGVANGQYTVRVDAMNQLPGWNSAVKVEEGRDVGGIDIILNPASEMNGRVVGPTGAPVPGATVNGNYSGTAQQRQWGFVGALPGNPTAQSDAEGRFTLRGLKPGNYQLWATAPGFAAGSVQDVGPGTEVVVTLGNAERISGVVKDPEGNPLAGVPVQARNADNSRGRNNWWWGGSQVFTGPDGSFEIPDLVEGVYDLTVNTSWLWGRSVNVRDTTQQGVRTGRDDVEIIAEAGTEISGRVLGDEDRPVTTGWVSASGQNGNNRGFGGNQKWARLGSDGSFRISGLAPGAYTVHVQGTFLSDPMQGVSSGTTDLEIRVRTSKTISGWLVDGSGLSVATGFNMQIRAPGAEDWAWTQIYQPGDGAFILVGLKEGAYDLKVQAHPFAPVEVGDVLAGRDDVEIRLQEGREISGVIVDGRGNPVRANVQVTQVNVPAGSTGSNGWSRTANDGVFNVQGLVDGDFRLYVRAGGHAPAVVEPVRGGSTDLRVILEAGVSVTGTLKYETGDPVVGARLQLDGDNGVSVSWSRTDAEGNFEFKNVPDGGEWTLRGNAWVNGQALRIEHAEKVASGATDVAVTAQ